MQMIILSIHLLVCVCLIGLVLLQRSEGGALGIGGGGGGALMSGRGASDALANLTAIAGALFLGVSLLLTWLSGAGDGPTGRSVFDNIPAITAPAEQAPPAVEQPAPTTPDPTESRAPSATELAAAILPGPAPAAAEATTPAPSGARAAPLESRPPAVQQTVAQQPAAQPRPAPAQAQPAAAQQRQPAPSSQNAVSGVSLAEPTTPESVDLGGVGVVRRERAGPDQ